MSRRMFWWSYLLAWVIAATSPLMCMSRPRPVPPIRPPATRPALTPTQKLMREIDEGWKIRLRHPPLPGRHYQPGFEVRLLMRRLHLFRPDLIPYPLQIETIC